MNILIRRKMDRRWIPILCVTMLSLCGCNSINADYVVVNSSEPSINLDASVAVQENKKMMTTQPAELIKEQDDEEIMCAYTIVQKSYRLTDANKVNVKYPEICDMNDKRKQQAINDLIKNDLFATQIDEQLEDVKKTIKEWGEDDAYYLELDYDITMFTDKILSIMYTGIGSFKTSAFPAYTVYAITIDLNTLEKLKLSDFIDINEELIDTLKESTNVTNQSVESESDREALHNLIKEDSSMDQEWYLDLFRGYPGGSYNFAVTPESLYITFDVMHGAGDYAIVEIPYKHTKYK